jgi:hypothetical protein
MYGFLTALEQFHSSSTARHHRVNSQPLLPEEGFQSRMLRINHRVPGFVATKRLIQDALNKLIATGAVFKLLSFVIHAIHLLHC